MNQSTLFIQLIQALLSEEEINEAIHEVDYEDTARKFNVHTLCHYWLHAAFGKWESFRYGADCAPTCGLPPVHYSTFSKKASDVPYELFQKLFDNVVAKCNRTTKRRLDLPEELLLVDSTTITVGKNRLPWAPFHGERSGIKLHVAFDASTSTPVQVAETLATVHDGPVGEQFEQEAYILVQDRAYGKIERFDRYVEDHQRFVIRLKDNVELTTIRPLPRCKSTPSNITRDIVCFLGTPITRSIHAHRIVFFEDDHGNEIRVVTNLLDVPSETIAAMYRARWQVELFFRFIKQHLNVPTLFGTTRNAVFGQLYAALITYVLLKWLYDQPTVTSSTSRALSFIRFTRLLCFDSLPLEWRIPIERLLSQSMRE